MRSLLQFLGISSAVIAVNAGTLVVTLWALSVDGDPTDERVASSLLWSLFWPLAWPWYWLKGKTSPVTTTQSGACRESARRFRTIREAKQYLAGVIADEAERDGTPLTEVERKMLFFAETGWTLPDMKEVSAEFDRNCDQDQYEQKIAAIITNVRTRFADKNPQEQMTWALALQKLSRGDHYLSVLANESKPSRRGTKHNLKVLFAALVLFAVVWADVQFWHWLRNR